MVLRTGKTNFLTASKTLAAFLTFSLLCITMSAFSLGKLPPDDFSYPTWTTWKIDNYLTLPVRANVVFLGSSLVLTPMGEADANFTNKELDATTHHKSLLFETEFEKQTGHKVNTFNFAVPGEMPSDAYLITNFLLGGEKRPDVIVYGVGPRDFLENTLVNPAATNPFRYLSRLGDYSTHIDLIKPGLYARLDHELANLFYPYGNKVDFQTTSERWTKKVIAQTFPDVKQLNLPERKSLMPEYHPYEIQPGETFFRPTKADKNPPFKDNINEYKYRYKKMKWETFNGQMTFLEDLLKVAKMRGIHVVVVAMPITKLNKDLLKKEQKLAYKSNLQKLTSENNATFLNLDESNLFNRNDFADSVHLHARGGEKFFNILAAKLAEDKTVLASLNALENKSRAVAELEDSTL